MKDKYELYSKMCLVISLLPGHEIYLNKAISKYIGFAEKINQNQIPISDIKYFKHNIYVIDHTKDNDIRLGMFLEEMKSYDILFQYQEALFNKIEDLASINFDDDEGYQYED